MALQREKSIDERVLSLEYDKETTERHLKEVREVGQKTANDVTDIKNAIIGNLMNGDHGLVHQIRKIEEAQDNHKDTLITHKVYFRQIGVVVGAIVVAVVGLIVAIIKQKNTL